MKKILFCFGLLLLIVSCNTAKNLKSTKITDLLGAWVLQNDDESEIGLQNKKLEISFSNEEGNMVINGFAGCNNFFGNFNSYQGSLNISNMGVTKMACPQLDLENDYLDLLEQVNRFERKGDNLFLYKDNLLLLHYKR